MRLMLRPIPRDFRESDFIIIPPAKRKLLGYFVYD